MIDFSNIDRLKKALDARRPLPPEAVRNLRDDLVVRWTYHTNAIEGNTLTLKETKVVLEGVTVGGKTMREHLEAVNHRDAIGHVEALVRENAPLSERQVKSVHRLVLKSIDDKNAGVYRAINVIIAGAEHEPPEFARVPDEMRRFIQWRQDEAGRLHPVERAARVHAKFVKIHPFVDGNGRTSRLLMNLELMKDGFPPVVLPVEKRLEYYQALDTAHVRREYRPFLAFVAAEVENSFRPYWRALGVSP